MRIRKTIVGIIFFLFLCAPSFAYDIRLLSETPLKGKASAIALNSSSDTAVVISEAGQSLYIIDTVSSSVIHEMPISSTPTAVAVHKAGNKVIVSTKEGSVLLFDLKSGEQTGKVDAGTSVYSIAVDETQNKAVLGVDGGLKIFDLTKGEVSSSIGLTGNCVKISLAKDGAVVVSREDNGTKLRLIDLDAGTVKKETAVSGDVLSIGLDESLGYILVAQAGKTGLLLYDSNRLELLGEIKTEGAFQIVSVNPSTHRAFLANTSDGSISVADLERKAVIDTVKMFDDIGAIAVDATKNRAIVSHGNTLAVLQLENPVPKITKLVPEEGAADEKGLPLSITGERFIKSSEAQFDKKALDTIFETNEQLQTNIPQDRLLFPGDVTVAVTNPAPGGGTSNEVTFKVLTPAPQLAAIFPETVAIGKSVSIRLEGKNFLPSATINLNGKKIAAGFISSTVLEASIDSSYITTKGSYPVSVTNNGTNILTSNPLTLTVADSEPKQETKAATIQGVGSLTGKILNTEMRPLNGVTITYKTVSARTDANGIFAMSNIPAGKRTILIDGSSAVEADGHYPTIPITVDITANAVNQMPFVPYLHRQKDYNFVNIDQGSDTILTDPEVPGFEMRIPRGVKIIGWDGQANIKVSVRTVPTDRLPVKPLPKNSFVRTVYMFYFDKVGGGKPDRPIPIKSPNDLGLLPGEKAVLYYYDESPIEGEAPNDWAIAGTGTVSDDGRFIVSDPGVGIPKFCCGATAWGGQSASLPTSGKEGQCSLAGDPVDVSTGYFMHDKTDLVIPGIIPVEIKRIYRNRDGGSAVSGTVGLGAFGKGMYLSVDWWLGNPNPPSSMLRLTKPGSYQYDFALQGDGSYLNTVDPEFRGAKVTVNADSTKTLRMRDGWTYKFNSFGELIEIADRNGNKNTIARVHGSPDEGGHISSITTAEGRVITFNQTYTGNFYQTDSIVDSAGRTVKYTYETDPFNSYPRLKQVDYPDGSYIAYGYIASGYSLGSMSTITNGKGVVEVTNVYDADNRVTSQTHPDGGIYTFSYTIEGGYITQTTMTEPNTAQTTWRFIDDSGGYRNSYITKKITPDGTTTYNKAAGTNELLSVTDPLNRTTTYTYYSTTDAKNGLVNTVTDPLGNVTTYNYETTYGLPTSITDALGKITTIAYTPAGAPPTQAVIKDPLLDQTTINYDAYGMPISITDPNNNTTTLQYDPNHHGELTGISDPLGNSIQISYDTLGRPVTLTDAKGKATTYTYDLMDRVTAVTDANSAITKYLYDLKGNLAMLIDPKNNSIMYEYDNRDRITKMTDQLQRYETYSYYTNTEITATTGDNLKSITDRKGQVTTFNEYDSQNRLKKVTFNDGSYTQYTYDVVGRTTNIYDTISGNLSYTYNDFGCSSCSGRGLDRISQETTPLSTLNYTYDQDGRRLSMTVAGEQVVNYVYDAAGRMTSLSRKIGTKTRTYPLTYDNGSRRATLKIPLSTNNKYVTTTYGYDIANRLTSMLLQGPSVQIENLLYTYDANSNRTNFTRNAAQTLSPAMSDTSYDEANEMLAYNSKTLTYDNNGNLISKTDASGTTTYTWDARNRLTAINGPSLTANFSYDALGRRISKTINGTTTQFVYDGWDITQEIKAGVKTNYIRTLNIDEPLTRITGSTVRHYVMDALGSVFALTDDSGAVKTTYVYDAFGNATVSGESTDNPFQFAGRENDGTGLLHERYRDYSFELQRYISEDPIRLAGGDINYYSRVAGNPVNHIDPLGLKRGDWWDIRTYIEVSNSSSLFIKGTQFNRNSTEQTTLSATLVGRSIDVQIGGIPCEKDYQVEGSVGLGKHLGIGIYFAQQENGTAPYKAGIAIHFGYGLGSPINITGTLPTDSPNVRWY